MAEDDFLSSFLSDTLKSFESPEIDIEQSIQQERALIKRTKTKSQTNNAPKYMVPPIESERPLTLSSVTRENSLALSDDDGDSVDIYTSTTASVSSATSVDSQPIKHNDTLEFNLEQENSANYNLEQKETNASNLDINNSIVKSEELIKEKPILDLPKLENLLLSKILPEDVKEQIRELEIELEEGDITIKGMKKKKDRILEPFKASILLTPKVIGKLAQLKEDLEEEDITEKGYWKKRAKLLEKYGGEDAYTYYLALRSSSSISPLQSSLSSASISSTVSSLSLSSSLPQVPPIITIAKEPAATAIGTTALAASVIATTTTQTLSQTPTPVSTQPIQELSAHSIETFIPSPPSTPKTYTKPDSKDIKNSQQQQEPQEQQQLLQHHRHQQQQQKEEQETNNECLSSSASSSSSSSLQLLDNPDSESKVSLSSTTNEGISQSLSQNLKRLKENYNINGSGSSRSSLSEFDLEKANNLRDNNLLDRLIDGTADEYFTEDEQEEQGEYVYNDQGTCYYIDGFGDYYEVAEDGTLLKVDENGKYIEETSSQTEDIATKDFLDYGPVIPRKPKNHGKVENATELHQSCYAGIGQSPSSISAPNDNDSRPSSLDLSSKGTRSSRREQRLHSMKRRAEEEGNAPRSFENENSEMKFSRSSNRISRADLESFRQNRVGVKKETEEERQEKIRRKENEINFRASLKNPLSSSASSIPTSSPERDPSMERRRLATTAARLSSSSSIDSTTGSPSSPNLKKTFSRSSRSSLKKKGIMVTSDSSLETAVKKRVTARSKLSQFKKNHRFGTARARGEFVDPLNPEACKEPEPEPFHDLYLESNCRVLPSATKQRPRRAVRSPGRSPRLTRPNSAFELSSSLNSFEDPERDKIAETELMRYRSSGKVTISY